MSEYLLHALFDATWQAAVLAGVVFLVTVLLRERLQPRWRYLLWCVVLLRLALPVLPEAPWGIWNENRTAVPVSATIGISEHPITPAPSFDVAEFTHPEEFSSIVSETKSVLPVEPKISWTALPWKTVLLSVWFFGVVFLFAKYCWNEYRLRRQSRNWKTPDGPGLLALFESCRRETGVRRGVRLKTSSDDVGAGCFGFFSPTIVLSESATKMHAGELRMILLHELVHLKRFDPLVLRLSTLLSLIHWPNPLVWFVLSRLQRERELACDAAVLHILGQQKQKDYGLAILAFAEMFPCRERLPGLVGVFEKNGTARRIDMIIKYKRSKWPHALLGLLLITLIAAVGLTKTQTENESSTTTNPNEIQVASDDIIVFENGSWKNEKTGANISEGTLLKTGKQSLLLSKSGESGKLIILRKKTDADQDSENQNNSSGNFYAGKINVANKIRIFGDKITLEKKPSMSLHDQQSNQIRIKTVDESGKPLGKVDIRVLMGDFKDENRPKTTDDDGNMVLRLPESPKELYISANSSGRVPQIVYWEKEDFNSRAKIPGEIVFTLRKGTTIGGLVVDKDGKPVEGAVLQILSRPNGYGMPGHFKPADSHILAYGDGKPNTFGGITSCKTDRNGRWTLDNVPEGKFVSVHGH